MSFKQYLMSLQWNTFERYPPQEEAIWIHCVSNDDHKFLKIFDFNAIRFIPSEIIAKLPTNQTWQLLWLPAKQIKEQ